MRDIKVKYTSACCNPSGYGSAARSFITSLYSVGVDVSTEIVSQMAEVADYGWPGALCQTLQSRDNSAKIKLIHLTPDLYPTYMEKGMYHIAHLFFETDRLPKTWVGPCNQMQELWTASEQQAEMIKKSGVTTPIKWFSQPLNIDYPETPFPKWRIPNFDGFIFYSMFQWIDRKNPRALLTTYWKTFSGINDVALVLKTYRNNYSESEFNKLKDDIRKWKTELGLKHYPKVYLVKKLMNSQEIFRLHKSANCFVSASSGEGWNIPAVEACLMEKPVIAIDKTGFADVFPQDLFYPVKWNEVQATEVPHIPWYTADMSWWAIDEKDLASKMLEAYSNPKEVQERGKRAQEFVKENLNYWTIGKQMRERLTEILKFL